MSMFFTFSLFFIWIDLVCNTLYHLNLLTFFTTWIQNMLELRSKTFNAVIIILTILMALFGGNTFGLIDSNISCITWWANYSFTAVMHEQHSHILDDLYSIRLRWMACIESKISSDCIYCNYARTISTILCINSRLVKEKSWVIINSQWRYKSAV